MRILSMLLVFTLAITTPLLAHSFYPLTSGPLKINSCPVEETRNILDLALINDGYFVVSQDKKMQDRLFTRYGAFLLNSHGYIVSYEGDYLLGINKKSEPNKLSRLKISSKNLPPKASTKIKMVVNLPAMGYEGHYLENSSTIYDSISGQHVLTVRYKKINYTTWETQVFIDKMELNKGQLIFELNGELSHQEGLNTIVWPTDYGLNELAIDYSESTSYGSPFSLQAIQDNGYPVGSLSGLDIDRNGDISLIYSNGVSKKLKNRIAVAKFQNPRYLEHVRASLYRASEKSGTPRLHRMNSDYALLIGYLEIEPCYSKAQS